MYTTRLHSAQGVYGLRALKQTFTKSPCIYLEGTMHESKNSEFLLNDERYDNLKRQYFASKLPKSHAYDYTKQCPSKVFETNFDIAGRVPLRLCPLYVIHLSMQPFN